MKPPARITVRMQEAKWRTAGVDLRDLRRAAGLALVRAKCSDRGGQLTILLADDDCLRLLNEKFCGKPFPTDVLSFPAAQGAKDCLGDVAIAHGVAARDAAAWGTPLACHVTHLAVHGVLHLLGYDHATVDEARVMEPLETAILGAMGIPDPYARVPYFG